MKGRILAAGFFDGVHLAHRAIISLADAVLTFRNHPLAVLSRSGPPPLLMAARDRIDMLHSVAGEVIALDFTAQFAAKSAYDFAREIKSLGFDAVRCGANWRFGRGGEGGAETLRAAGIEAIVVPDVLYAGERISSTRIRSAVAKADFESAAAMLGREWSLSGEICRGKGLGAAIGRPTVNVVPDEGLQTPPPGVYAVSANGQKGVANFGVAPTMGALAWEKPVLEIHFPDAHGAHLAFGSSGRVHITFCRFIRPERKFDSVDQLRRQIAEDVVAAWS